MSLQELYYDPKSGYLTANRLYKKAKTTGLDVKVKDVKQFVKDQLAHQLTKQTKKPTIYNTINAPKVRSNYQLDLLIYDRFQWGHYRYILVVIDVHSRYVAARALTNRRGETILEAVKECFEDLGGPPENMNGDNEFNTLEFNKAMKEDGVRMWYSEPDEINKNAIVERFNRTLALLIQRWRVGSGSHDWPKALPYLIYNYNHTYHSTIKGTPADVFKGKQESRAKVIVLIPSFQIGDQVRIKEKKLNPFTKGDTLTYSRDVYQVTKVGHNRITLETMDGQTDRRRTYKPYELVKVGAVQFHPPAITNPTLQIEAAKVDQEKLDRIVAKANKHAGVSDVNILPEKREPKLKPALLEFLKGKKGK
jgi:hypothetical protein